MHSRLVPSTFVWIEMLSASEMLAQICMVIQDLHEQQTSFCQPNLTGFILSAELHMHTSLKLAEVAGHSFLPRTDQNKSNVITTTSTIYACMS